MKKIIFIVVILAFTVNSFAQKKGSPEQRANATTEYVAKNMDLSKKETKFLNKTLQTKFNDVSSKIKGNNFSKEEKKAIYKDSNKWVTNELKTKFSDKEVKQIFSLIKEFNKKNKK